MHSRVSSEHLGRCTDYIRLYIDLKHLGRLPVVYVYIQIYNIWRDGPVIYTFIYRVKTPGEMGRLYTFIYRFRTPGVMGRLYTFIYRFRTPGEITGYTRFYIDL